MTKQELLDHFAGLAMQVFLRFRSLDSDYHTARVSYELARAMLEYREGRLIPEKEVDRQPVNTT